MNKWVLFFLFCLKEAAGATNSRQGEMCSVSSLCSLCRSDEASANYCSKTGRRVELSCRVSDDAPPIIRHRSCDRTAQDDLLYFFEFQLAMVILGIFALYLAQRRKLRHQSLYDRRSRRGNSGISSTSQNPSLLRNDCL